MRQGWNGGNERRFRDDSRSDGRARWRGMAGTALAGVLHGDKFGRISITLFSSLLHSFLLAFFLLSLSFTELLLFLFSPPFLFSCLTLHQFLAPLCLSISPPLSPFFHLSINLSVFLSLFFYLFLPFHIFSSSIFVRPTSLSLKGTLVIASKRICFPNPN